jgi:hypothetical protein
MKQAYARKLLSTGEPRHVIVHELGHLHHARSTTHRRLMNGDIDVMLDRKTKDAQFRQSVLPRVKKHGAKVSRYAMSDPAEFVAEVFAGTLQGKTYDVDVMKLYRDLEGPTPGALLKGRARSAVTSPLKVKTATIKPPAMPSVRARVFEGKPKETKVQIGGKGRHLILGDFSEDVIALWLKDTGAKVEQLGLTKDEKANDLAAWVKRPGEKQVIEAIEAKGGEIINTSSAQRWRITKGEPSEK